MSVVREVTNWEPPTKFKEHLKELLPAQLRIKYLYDRNIRKGEIELRLVPFLANENRVSLDVGANKGVYSYAMLPCSAEVHAFEPNPKLFRMLKRWGKGKISLHRVALSNSSGTAELLVPKGKRGYSNQGASLSMVKVDDDYGAVTVQTVRLDELGIENVGFIKIDVEGFEREVLEGSVETLRRDRPNLLLEMEELHTKIALEDMIETVCRYGYECLTVLHGTLTPFHLIDPKANHRIPASRSDYVFNFIFLPI